MADDPSTAFLKWAYEDQYPEVLVFYTAQDPGLRGYGWAMTRVGDLERRGLWPPGEQTNNYFCVSLCAGDRRQAVYWKSLHVLAIDDVGTKVPEQILLDRFGVPGWVWETSPGNFQWFYKLVPPVRNRDVALQLVHLLKNDAKDIVKLMRLPVGKNNKAKYGLGDAGFKTRIIARADQVSVNSGLNSHGQLDPAEVLASWDADSVPEELKPNKPTGLSGALSTRPGKSVLDLIGEDPLGKCLLAMGRVKHMIPSRLGVEIQCPWEHEHTVRTETGTAYFPQTQGFECQHGHCQDRTGKDLRAAIEEEIDKSGLWEGGVMGVAGQGFDSIDDDSGPVHRDVVLRDYIYVGTENKYLHRPNKAWLGVQAFNTLEKVGLRPWLEIAVKTAKTTTVKLLSPHTWFTGSGGGLKVHGQNYWPGKASIYVHQGAKYVNMWQPAARPLAGRVVSEQDVKPYLELVEALCANEGPTVAGWLLDWMALVICEPGTKPGWHWILQSSVHGVGKDMILRPLIVGVGEGNVASPDPARMGKEHNEYAAKRLVSISELKRTTRGQPTTHDAYSAIKTYTQNTTKEIEIRAMYLGPYYAPNLSAWVITANPEDAMALEESDRRFVVVMSTMPRRSDTYYAGMAAWLDDHEQEVVEYLYARYALMSAARRAMLLGAAPMTPGKTSMTRLAEDRVTSWTREQIEDGIWPDLMTSRQIQDAYDRAAQTRVLAYSPAGAKWGPMVRKFGCRQWGSGQAVKLPGGVMARIWVIRNTTNYEQMSHGDITKAYELQTSF